MAQKTPRPTALVPLHTAVAVAACTYAAVLTAEVDGGLFLLQLTPAGAFLPSDGRTLDSPAWNLDAASAQAVIARFSALQQPPVIDYEHQTLNKEKNGQPAPAAGWMRDMRWVEGQGLYAVAELTERARAYIQSGEYKYFSPVFEYSKESGTVLAIHMGALTNTPAIHGMDPLTLRAAATAAFITPQPPPQEFPVNPLLKALLAALGLPDTTTETAACAALTAVGSITALQAQATAARQALALPADATGDAVIAACTSLRTAAPDPAKFVPVNVVDELRSSLAVLTSRQTQGEIDAAVGAGLADGRLLPAQEVWARDLGKSNIAALSSYLATAQPIGALTGTQTNGKPPGRTDMATGAQLSPEQLAVCSAMGLTAEQFIGVPAATA